jgi:hypothetical protein
MFFDAGKLSQNIAFPGLKTEINLSFLSPILNLSSSLETAVRFKHHGRNLGNLYVDSKRQL